MRLIILFIAAFLILDVNAQAPPQTDGISNKTDSLGHKQGLWTTFYKNTRVESKGYYKNDKKVGKWEYYTSESDNYHLGKIEEYNNDGSVNILLGKKTISINHDSSIVTLVWEKTIKVNCTKNGSGNYSCERYGNDQKIYQKKVFPNFNDCMNHMESKW